MNDLLKEVQRTKQYIASLKKVNRNTRAAEIRLTNKLRGLFTPIYSQIVNELLKLNNIPSNDITRRILLEALFQAQDKFNKEMEEEIIEAAQRGANRTTHNMQRVGEGVTYTPLNDRARQVLLDHTFEASRRTLERMTGDVMQNLIESYDQGLGIDEAAERLRSKFQSMEDHELVRIARTEINSAQNMGAYLKNEEFGVEYHMWITAEDDRVRDGSTSNADHVSMHGQIVRVGDVFSNGLTHPGDRSGPIEEWINCRCVLVPFVMPLGKMPPLGKTHFYEDDLIDVA